MVFNSVTFLLFLALVTCCYWLLPRRPRLWMIFLGSLVFYGFWRWEFLPLMLLSSSTDYVVARQIHASKGTRRRKLLLLVSLTINLGLLFVFKYLIFFTENIWVLGQWLGIERPPPALEIILPLGISFYTFQTISYTIDVYRKFIRPERDYILYSCYVMYFPQLVAGPILRAGEVIPQLAERPRFRLDDIAWGLRRILAGLFLKVVLADNVAPLVDAGFGFPAESLSAIDVWTLAFLFGFQIYFDFSAYSHIAIGAARLMGIRFPENFFFPYLATSPRDFWKRWHISLSSWIRDYLYLPLAGAKVHDRSTGGLAEAARAGAQTAGHRTRALFLTWAIMGLWHGAAWTFVVWGLWHAALIYGYRILGPLQNWIPVKLRPVLGWALTLGLVMLSWVPFRAEGLEEMAIMLGRVVDPRAYLTLGLRENTYLVAAALLCMVVGAYLVAKTVIPWLQVRPILRIPVETAAFSVVCALVFVFLRPIQQFIYFQF